MIRCSKHILLLLIAFHSLLSNGQDLHFSQFNQSPLNLNPSLTGNFSSSYRLIANYRNQWSNVGEPYKTFSFSAEARGLFGIKKLSYGALFYNDKAGAGELAKSNYGMSVNYSQNLNYDSSLSISIGALLAFQQYKIDFNQLSFDQQYDGYSFNSNLGNGENFEQNSFAQFNPSFGVHLNYVINSRNAIKIGYSIHNLLTPRNSFFDEESVILQQRNTIHFSSNFGVNQLLDIQPSLLYMTQGKYREFVIGTNFRYYLERTKYSKKALTAGIYYRNQDAAFASIGMEVARTSLGLSYDFNISELNTATNKNGGFEISIVHLISNYKPSYKRGTKCPNFM
ncbi:PorP/SprF family type IX secretion system membrane protein [Acidiluteibacter ferrifornacis]|uniref:Type IX secretion system membrane protein PorP/SprF n=1 Tax=Acidiluteibacter ferrifornacis TaxID=2692424 RepID=A0A6N9NHT8_9FLAO|nr:PorP/SprF family type IX secretion system membrane protein [Acidiluteibacter ferrifornacis]NBG66246.1 type IX secretion system membrane protein PorP/SprF [Acidiluteibacter ferrifornacis]